MTSSWKRYSWKAITCCVSKGMLVLLAIVSVVGGGIYLHIAGEELAKAKREHCSKLRLLYRNTPLGVRDEVWERGIAECDWPTREEVFREPEDEDSPVSIYIAAAILIFVAFVMGASLLSYICSATITYCQAAVDSRRPWYYWIPKIGRPLPPRETKTQTCPTCQHETTQPETEDEYRARLGLPPLGKA